MKILLKTNILPVLAFIFCYSTVVAQGYIFTEPADGVTVIEAEHYYDLIEGSAGMGNQGPFDFAGGLWAVAADAAGYTGEGYIQAPDFEGGIGNDNEDILAFSPAVRYRINFTQPGHHFWFARCSYDDGSSDSYHLGSGDSILFRKMNPYTQIGENFGSWGWNFNTASGAQAVWDVPEAGEHDILVYMREPNFRLDKIVIAMDATTGALALDEEGPAETLFTGVNDTYLSNTLQVFPNPAHSYTAINFDVLERGYLNASIYNLSGQLVTTLMDEVVLPGYQELRWNFGDNAQVSAGFYYLKINYAGGTIVRKLVVQK